MDDLGCRCGYVFPMVSVHVATFGQPSESVHIGMQCPKCGRWYGCDLGFKGRVDASGRVETPIDRGRVTKGGDA